MEYFFLQYKRIVLLLQTMIRACLLLLFLGVCHAVCTVGHHEFWSCALKKKCLNAYHLHAKLSKTAHKTVSRPFILAIEGPMYKRLYEDCDTNQDGCIDMDDIQHAGEKCKRSCIWRDAMHGMMCH